MFRIAPHVILLLATLIPVAVSGPVHVDGGPFPMLPNDPPGPLEYGVVVDAGSSGSRARVYSWPQQTEPNIVPVIVEIYNYKETPGISEFADNLDGLDEYVRHLVAMAAANVAEQAHAQTVLYFMATAGMRLLREDKANAVMDRINTILLVPGNNPFSYQPLNTRILSGEEEGVFAWTSVNYLNDFFNRHAVDPSALSSGLMEMGGASLQIAFVPDGSILADKFPVKVGGTIYPVYVHSYLYYGQDYADLWVKQYLFDEREQKNNISNPCMLKEDTITEEIRGADVTYIGVGNPDECREILDVYVYDVDPRRCHPMPCALGAVYQPTINPQQGFFAIGAFIFPLTLLDVLQPNGSFSLTETNSSAYSYCVKDIWTVQNETGRTDRYLSVECLTGLYIPTLLVKAFKFQADSTQLKAVKEINDQPTEWTLGALIYENERRGWTCPGAVGVVHGGATSVLNSPSPLALLTGIMFCLLFQAPSSLCPDTLQNTTTDRETFVHFLKSIH